MITYELREVMNLGFRSYHIEVDRHGFIGVTEETGLPAVLRLVEICKANEKELLETILQRDKDLKTNIRLSKEGKQGKFWPSMRKLEKLRNDWCKQAGIKDT